MLLNHLISCKRIIITYYDLRFEQSINRVQSNEKVFRPQRSSALDARRPYGRHRPRVFSTQRVLNQHESGCPLLSEYARFIYFVTKEILIATLIKQKKTEEKRTVSSFFVYEMLEIAFRLALISHEKQSRHKIQEYGRRGKKMFDCEIYNKIETCR